FLANTRFLCHDRIILIPPPSPSDAYCLFPFACSVLPIPYCLLPIPWSLVPDPWPLVPEPRALPSFPQNHLPPLPPILIQPNHLPRNLRRKVPQHRIGRRM